MDVNSWDTLTTNCLRAYLLTLRLWWFFYVCSDEELLGQGIELNDYLQTVLAKHDAIASGSPIPLQVTSSATASPSDNSNNSNNPSPQVKPPIPTEEDEEKMLSSVAAAAVSSPATPLSNNKPQDDEDEEDEDDFALLARRLILVSFFVKKLTCLPIWVIHFLIENSWPKKEMSWL